MAISLFSGCGGLDLGATRAGASVVWATDKMSWGADAIAQLLPDAEFHLEDIRRVRTFPRADLVLGGYPCQPFSMGGARDPASDQRSTLFHEFARAVEVVDPRFFVAENVLGLRSLGARQWLTEQIATFRRLGRRGYHVSCGVLDAADYGLPQRRRRIFLVGVRTDLRRVYRFPPPTHGRAGTETGLKQWLSHGDALAAAGLPSWPTGEFYERPADPDGGFSWWYRSRNRKARWEGPAATVLAAGRHVGLHPASCTMRKAWSRLDDGFKQGWEFTGEYEHLDGRPERMALERPRRLSWRECALLQGFPGSFEPSGSMTLKYQQIGNAVPPGLAEAVVRPLVDESGLVRVTNLSDSERALFNLQLRGVAR